ncbi:MAG: PAS domain S-box protein, partial [Chloroflexi bacterium]|nr:PAS domain S-box protein [Chloroflexota bacterium]
FLGTISWLGPFAYVFGLIFANTFLDLRRGLIYTSWASLAFVSLILLEATGTIPHQVYLEQGAMRYTDAQFVVSTAIGGVGVFFSIYLWVNWVGRQLRRERDGAVRAQEEVLGARSELERANAELEERVIARSAQFEQANAALQESETQFRTLAETMTAVVVIVRDKRILYVNQATEAVTGYSREELLRMDFEDVIHPDSQPLVKGRGASHERGEDVAPRFELKILAKNGETRWLDIGSSSIEFEGSEALLATAFDVTDRKQAEKALRVSEDRYRDYYDHAPNAYLSMDVETGQIVECNQTTVEMLGRRKEEIVGHKAAEFYTPASLERARAAFGVFLSRGEVHSIDLQVQRGDGTVIDVTLDATAVRAPDGRIVRSRSMWRDVTERRRAEEALRVSETKFRSLAETVSVAVFILRGEKMLYVNSAAETLSGYTHEELLEMNFWETVHPEVQEEMRTRGMAKQRGESAPGEQMVKIVTKAGQERWVEFRLSTIMYDGEPAMLGAAFDVTERKQAVEALRESEARYRWLIEGAPYAMVIANDEGRIVMVNAETEKLFRYNRIQLIGEPLEILMPERFQEAHLGHRAGYLENPYTRPMGMSLTDLVGRRSDASEFPIDIHLSGLKTDSGVLVTAVIRDITEHKQAQDALQEQARRDPLTNLLNRRAGLVAMEERLARAKSAGGQFAVLVIDIDRFKIVNDVFGHEAGDNALIRLGLIMAEVVGEEGIACRQGGDEFEIGLEGAGLYQAVLCGEELRAALRRSLEASSADDSPEFTISIGVACYPQDGATIAVLGRCADRAMYAAKAAGCDATRAWSLRAPRQAA